MTFHRFKRLGYSLLVGGFLMQSCNLDLDVVGSAAEASLESFFSTLITTLINGLVEF